MDKQDILQKAVMLKQQSEETEQQLDFVNQQIRELEEFNASLRFLNDTNEKEILAPLGKGVYVKALREFKEKLFVEVGAGVVVKKTPGETKEVIKKQIEKFNFAKVQLLTQLEKYASELRKILEELKKIKDEE